MKQDEKSKRNEEEIVKKLYKNEREKLEKLKLWEISEKEELYAIRKKILESLETEIASLPIWKDAEKLMAVYRKELPAINEVAKTKQELWDKATPKEKAEYEYQKMLVKQLEEYLKKEYKLIPVKDFERKLQFEAIDKKVNKKLSP